MTRPVLDRRRGSGSTRATAHIADMPPPCAFRARKADFHSRKVFNSAHANSPRRLSLRHVSRKLPRGGQPVYLSPRGSPSRMPRGRRCTKRCYAWRQAELLPPRAAH